MDFYERKKRATEKIQQLVLDMKPGDQKQIIAIEYAISFEYGLPARFVKTQLDYWNQKGVITFNNGLITKVS